ncbi:MAG: NAD(P)H-dependent oxidoreductase [Pseudomonadota bacterium]
MSHILRVDSSAATATSASRKMTDSIIQTLAPSQTTVRDLNDPLPQITGEWAAARLVPAADRTPAETEILSLSDTLVAELMAADTLVIGMPMYNFGIPASLKLWIDLIARPKLTFEYTPGGPNGLVTGKRAIVAAASGGVPLGAPVDFATPHLKQVLTFIGITDITVIDAKDPYLAASIANLG